MTFCLFTQLTKQSFFGFELPISETLEACFQVMGLLTLSFSAIFLSKWEPQQCVVTSLQTHWPTEAPNKYFGLTFPTTQAHHFFIPLSVFLLPNPLQSWIREISSIMLTSKINYCLNLIIKRIIIKNGYHRLKLS